MFRMVRVELLAKAGGLPQAGIFSNRRIHGKVRTNLFPRPILTIAAFPTRYKALQKSLTSSAGSDEEFTLDEDGDDTASQFSAVSSASGNKRGARDKSKPDRKKFVAELLSKLTASQINLTLIPALVDGNYLVPKKRYCLQRSRYKFDY